MYKLTIAMFLVICTAAAFAHREATRAARPPSAPADLIITNAKIYTVNRSMPWAEAVAVKGGRIIGVGRTSRILHYRGPGTRMVDAQQHLVLPGFTDSHIHFMAGSLSLGRINLQETKNVAEIQKMVKKYAAEHPASMADDPWILGRGWSYAEFGAEALPHKKYLDEIVPDRPVLLEGFDGHTYWANSKALQLAGIDRNTPDPRNGKIVRDPTTGEPTGALLESAADLVVKILPQPARQERLMALRSGLALANKAGLTRVISCADDAPGESDSEYLDLFEQLRREGALTLRFYVSSYVSPAGLTTGDLKTIESIRERYKRTDEWIEGGAVKLFLDGVIEAHTAAMLTEYEDEVGEKGSLRWDPSEYKRTVLELDRLGIQVFTHAIGDRAVRLALDAYAEAKRTNRTAGTRHRVEHVETISARDISRFGSIGVIASMQPLHAYPDDDTLGPWLKAAGKEREPRAFAWQSIAKAGGRLAFGSDWPVVTLNPWQGIQNAVTRQTRDNKPEGGWVPEQRLTLTQAIEGYTLGAAYSGHREKTEGSIAPGKLADMIMVSQNVFEIDPHKIAETEVLLTIVSGKTVYQSPHWKQDTDKMKGN